MNQHRIDTLRDLADRGVGGEKENAKAILIKLGIDWRKPKVSLGDKIKKTFGGDITKGYSIRIERSSDILFICQLLLIICPDHKGVTISGSAIEFKCTAAQKEDLTRIFFKHRENFDYSMVNESNKYIKDYLWNLSR